MSNGLDDGRGKLFSRVGFSDMPPVALVGVRDPEESLESWPHLDLPTEF